MAQVTVGTTAVQLPISASVRAAIWNAGPGTLYLQRSEADTTVELGWPLASGVGYEWPTDRGSKAIWAISDDSSDVRILEVG